MSTKTNIATYALAALMIAGAVVSTPRQAAAYTYIDIGPMSGMFNDILDNALTANRAYYGTGSPHCPWVRTSDRYGHYVGHVRTCMLPPTFSHGVLSLRSRRLGD